MENAGFKPTTPINSANSNQLNNNVLPNTNSNPITNTNLNTNQNISANMNLNQVSSFSLNIGSKKGSAFNNLRTPEV